MRYSIELRGRIYVKGYEFLSFSITSGSIKKFLKTIRNKK